MGNNLLLESCSFRQEAMKIIVFSAKLSLQGELAPEGPEVPKAGLEGSIGGHVRGRTPIKPA
ncbi:MAG TPA: hypothetical protein DCR93_00525 [Cytophagales bacterium]|nr:hypothetical protein [Cytophagales bacterium]